MTLKILDPIRQIHAGVCSATRGILLRYNTVDTMRAGRISDGLKRGTKKHRQSGGHVLKAFRKHTRLRVG